MSSPSTDVRVEYDLPTAVTFLMVGLAVGSILTILFSPRTEKPKPKASRAPARQPSPVVQPVD